MVARNRLRQGHRPEPGRRPAARTNGSNGATPTPGTPRAWRTLGIRLPRLYAHCRRLGAVQVDRLRLVAADASLRLMAGSLLVLTTGRRFCERYVRDLKVKVIRCPVPLPALNYYQLWHDLTHRSAASRWLREQVRDVVRGLHQVQPPVRHH